MRLLGRDDVGLNPVNSEGLTLLGGTVRYGHVETVKTWLGCPSVDLNLGDRDGRSLLSLVAKASYEDVLRMNRPNADPNSVEGETDTAFSGCCRLVGDGEVE